MISFFLPRYTLWSILWYHTIVISRRIHTFKHKRYKKKRKKKKKTDNFITSKSPSFPLSRYSKFIRKMEQRHGKYRRIFQRNKSRVVSSLQTNGNLISKTELTSRSNTFEASFIRTWCIFMKFLFSLDKRNTVNFAWV